MSIATDRKKAASEKNKETYQYVENQYKKTISINPQYKRLNVKYQVPDEKCKSYRCTMCGTVYTTQEMNFLKSTKSVLWRGNNGYTTFCKTCGIALFSALVDFYSGNQEHAIRHLCCIFDWFYSPLASAMAAVQLHHGGSLVTLYPGKASAAQVANKGESFIDTLKAEMSSFEAITTPQDEPSDEDSTFIVTDKILKTWGRGYSAAQYEYLQEQYEDWITTNECKTKAQEELFRNLCLAQLNTRVAQREGNQKAAADWMKVFQDLLGSNNLKPTQTADNAMSSAQTFGTLIKKIEDTRPIAEPEPEWKDVDGIRKYVNTWFRGGLAKALHIKHDCVPLYEEAVKEYAKYTVSPPTNAATDTADTSIFDVTKEEGGDSDGSSNG